MEPMRTPLFTTAGLTLFLCAFPAMADEILQLSRLEPAAARPHLVVSNLKVAQNSSLRETQLQEAARFIEGK